LSVDGKPQILHQEIFYHPVHLQNFQVSKM